MNGYGFAMPYFSGEFLMTPASNSSQQTPDALVSISFSASAPKMETNFDPRSAANFFIAGEFTAALNAVPIASSASAGMSFG